VKKQKGGTMKPALIRMITVAVCATSMSAFAMAENAKSAKDKNSDSTNVETAVESNIPPTLDELLAKVDQLQLEVQQIEARDNENQGVQKTKQEETNKKIRQQDKEWEHSLMGIYGG
jgi:TolA-binding protein